MIKHYLGLFVILVCVVFLSVCFATVAFSFTITSPSQGAVFHPGDSVNVNLQFDPTDTPVEVGVINLAMSYGELLRGAPYIFTIIVPPTASGTYTLHAIAHYADGTATERKVEIAVVLPASVVLRRISVDPPPILLKKLPEGSDPNDIRISETRHIGVGGTYSDGIERYISPSSYGTTYTSSDEKVVRVDAEGNLKAQGIGDATIMVKNGKFSATVKVTVDPYEKWIDR